MTIARDTSPSAAAAQLKAIRAMDGPSRLLLAMSMSDEARSVTLAGIQARHPEWGPDAVRRELVRLTLGDDPAARAFDRE